MEKETPIEIPPSLYGAAIALASASMVEVPGCPEPSYHETPPWKQGEYKGGRPKANRGGVTRKSRFHVQTKQLRAEKKAARQRKKK